MSSGKKDLLEMLLKKGADTMRVGDPVLELAWYSNADRDMLELIMEYDSRGKKELYGIINAPRKYCSMKYASRIAKLI